MGMRDYENLKDIIHEKEVIDAMSYCFAVGDCDNCAYRDKDCADLMGDGLLIIKRRKGENERLETELKAMRGAANSLKMHLQTARAEISKELAERLKQTRVDLGGIEMVAVGDIDAIAEQMTEE